MTENQLTPSFDPAAIVKPEPEHVRRFLEELAKGTPPDEAALVVGITRALAVALLNQPAFRAALDVELERRLNVTLVPKALAAVGELLENDVDRAMRGQEPIPAGVKGRVALGVMEHARKIVEAGGSGESKPLAAMTAAELEARAARLREQENELSNVVDGEYSQVGPLLGK